VILAVPSSPNVDEPSPCLELPQADCNARLTSSKLEVVRAGWGSSSNASGIRENLSACLGADRETLRRGAKIEIRQLDKDLARAADSEAVQPVEEVLLSSCSAEAILGLNRCGSAFEGFFSSCFCDQNRLYGKLSRSVAAVILSRPSAQQLTTRSIPVSGAIDARIEP